MKKSSFSVFWGIILSWIFILVGLFCFWQFNLRPISGNGQTVTFVVSKGEGLSEITEQLKLQGLIREQLSFKILVYVLGISKKMQAGSFNLSASMGSKEVALALTKAANDQRITILEGLRQEQTGQFLADQGFLVDPAVWSTTIKQNGLEGKLFPDTYFFPNRADMGVILKIINRNFEKKVLSDLDPEIKNSNLSLEEILTLSSIVEREARTDTDRKIIAGILLKRLKNNWALQVDATVQYAVATQNSKLKTQNQDWWPKQLTENDLKIKSPFNTYINTGLPPGPICNPGLSSIKAVLNPGDSPYWFYITGADGQTHYAKTSEEHAQNIQKYLQ